MTAASSAAVEGCAYGLLGADPRVVEGLCRKLCDIFYSHGAMRLQGPLLRPTDPNDADASLNKPVELLARRGSVLRLREDLCIPFARALGRGGSSTNNLKRFDINKVFTESDAGLHPKEMLEASFDIIQDESAAISEFLEAESILVLCRAMSLLAPKFNEASIAVLRSPVWELKLTHTRLSDAIMDLMFLPTSESIRHSCLNIFTAIMSCPPPSELCNQRRTPAKYKIREMKGQKIDFLDKCIETAVVVDKLPRKSGKRLRAFLSHFLMPQLDANKGMMKH
jgi:histidyl-tRNA synthetase